MTKYVEVIIKGERAKALAELKYPFIAGFGIDEDSSGNVKKVKLTIGEGWAKNFG